MVFQWNSGGSEDIIEVFRTQKPSIKTIQCWDSPWDLTPAHQNCKSKGGCIQMISHKNGQRTYQQWFWFLFSIVFYLMTNVTTWDVQPNECH